MNSVIWHDLECGRYTEDLRLWLDLAAQNAAPGQVVLDIGAGTGRVAIPLARAGYRVLALDADASLLLELERRATALPIETACADARSFRLDGRTFPLIVVPMQTLQLLGGEAGHRAFLEHAAAHLAPGGVVAVAVAAADDFEEFEWHDGDSAPIPDIAELGTCAYFSQPTAVRRQADTFVLERRREVVDGTGARTSSEDRIVLDIVSVQGLQEAGQRAGLHPVEIIEIAPTLEHIGSQVVVLGA